MPSLGGRQYRNDVGSLNAAVFAAAYTAHRKLSTPVLPTRKALACVAAEPPYEGEQRVVRHDGQTREVHLNAAPMRSADGALRGYVGTVEDIAQRTTLEEQFRQAQWGAGHAKPHVNMSRRIPPSTKKRAP